MIPEPGPLLPRLPDPLTVAGQRDTQVLCPLPRVKFSPRPGLSLSLWVACTAWAPPRRRKSIRSTADLLCGPGRQGLGQGGGDKDGKACLFGSTPDRPGTGLFPTSLSHKSSWSSYEWVLFDPGSKGARRVECGPRGDCLCANPGARGRDRIWKRVFAEATELRVST